MSIELRELYQEIIIDHNKDPRNHHPMEDANTVANGFNPLCGDKLTVYAKLNQGVIEDISFVGCGCAIAQASASLMTESVKGKTIEEADKLFGRVHRMLTKDCEYNAPMDKLTALSGVKAFPVRVKCATLAWHTMEAALHKENNTVSTE